MAGAASATYCPVFPGPINILSHHHTLFNRATYTPLESHPVAYTYSQSIPNSLVIVSAPPSQRNSESVWKLA